MLNITTAVSITYRILLHARSGKNVGHLEIHEVIQATARLTVMAVAELVTFANQACVCFLVSLVSAGLRSFHHLP